MESFVFHPPESLQEYIDILWLGKSADLSITSVHYAPEFTELIFNYGDRFEIKGENVAQKRSRESCTICISGLKKQPFITTTEGRYCSAGLLLKPYCFRFLQELLKAPILEKVERCIFRDLINTQRPDASKVFTLLEAFFSQIKLDPILQIFEQQISATFLERGALKRFSQRQQLSSKSFIQKFKKHYFITPAQYVKLRQINYARSLIHQRPDLSLGQIGLEAGFYDQPHFVRVFQQYMGSSPKNFSEPKVPG
ncbi:AraC family transcriptional regulator [Persicobacter diffluens]|uniref:HTH araC/xylS-type domain-containing protein n=1 Tax=Persicobacter diffluens TaxID=981 RepID=A0AAN4VYW1_9BACT|nr:hypothetical protein PEDI_14420 [Persicobacter diffluens]